MTVARLNVDVLEIVSEFLTEVADVLSFALISPLIRHIATRRLLSMRPIRLTGGASIRKFHAFLFADALAHTPHVCSLEIDKRPLSSLPSQPGDASLLIEILTFCRNIEHISVAIPDNNPSRLTSESDSRFIHAISGLQSLHSLSIVRPPIRGFNLLREVCAPLRTISLDRGYNDRFCFCYPAELNGFLAHFAPTLEKLHIHHFVVSSAEIKAFNHILTPESVFTMTQYPAVRSFSVGTLGGVPLLDHFQHIFPALDGTLSFGLSIFQCYDFQYSLEDIRAANQRAQESSQPRPWKKLDRLVCDSLMLYFLSIRCPIRHIFLIKGLKLMKPYVDVPLRENPVPRLTVTLHHKPSLFEGLFESTPELAATLTHLTLCLVWGFQDGLSTMGGMDNCRPRARWEDILDETVSSLKPLYKLTHLRVVIRVRFYHTSKDRSDDNTESPMTHVKDYVCAFRGSAFDFEATAASLVRPLPSLRYIFLATEGSLATKIENTDSEPWTIYEEWHVSRAWRVTEPGSDQPSLVELHDEVAETIILKEELTVDEMDVPEVYDACENFTAERADHLRYT